MKTPAAVTRAVSDNPRMPPGNDDRVSGFGVMGLPFRSGHVLALRRWTAASTGPGYTSIWHRDPEGRWTFYESTRRDLACTRYFGADVERGRVVPIDLEWQAPYRLHVSTWDGSVDWTLELRSTPMTAAMSILGSGIPLRAWRSRSVLRALGAVAGRVLKVGTVNLTGRTSNGQHFDANPLRVWNVSDSRATVEGTDLGPPGALDAQAHLADFYIPQRGIFSVGRVFVVPAPL
jgi:hypothetical protein